MASHFMIVCEVHGTIISQCRCPGPKTISKTTCPGNCDRRPKVDPRRELIKQCRKLLVAFHIVAHTPPASLDVENCTKGDCKAYVKMFDEIEKELQE